MKRDLIAATYLVGVSLCLAVAWADEPKIAKSTPGNNATDVPVNVGQIRIVFDRNMRTDSWTLQQAGDLPFPPMIPQDAPWMDPLTFALPVNKLAPRTTYGIQLNGERRKGFVSADDQTPLPITVIQFTTGADEAPAPATGGVAPVNPPPAPAAQPPAAGPFGPFRRAPAGSTPAATVPGNMPVAPATPPAVPQSLPQGGAVVRPGWRFNVSAAFAMNGVVQSTGAQPVPFRIMNQVVFVEEVTKAEGPRITESLREVVKAEVTAPDPQTGQTVAKPISQPGQKFRVTFGEFDGVVYDPNSNQEVMEKEVKDAFSSPLTAPFWPPGQLQAGQSWTYTGEDLAKRLESLQIKGGQMTMRVERIERDPQTGLLTAYIRGQLQAKTPFEGVDVDLNANLEIDLPVAVGVPIRAKLEGKASAQIQQQNQMGQVVMMAISMDLGAMQSCVPSQNVIADVSATAAPPAPPVAVQPPQPAQRPAGPATAPPAMMGNLPMTVAQGHPGTPEGAKALLQEFVKPGADCAALSRALRPNKEDYAAVFAGDMATQAEAGYEPAWNDGKIVIRPKETQTEVKVWSATTEEIKNGAGNAPEFPGGYQRVAPHLKDGLTLYRFTFVEPGQEYGMAYDGLVYVNGRWAIFPKPWRVMR